jgi:hypothetical protein
MSKDRKQEKHEYYLKNKKEIIKKQKIRRKSLYQPKTYDHHIPHPNGRGINHPNWKGDEVSYKSLHRWVRQYKTKPKLCEKCNQQLSYDIANISGKYLRDINDYLWLCRSCHMKSDKRLENLQNKHKIYDQYTDLPISEWQKWKLRHPNYKRKNELK